jgi:hypothetical protein
MTWLLLKLLALYRRWLSPALHSLNVGGCKYLPTCSEYAEVAIQRHGPVKGAMLAFWRLLRCNPFSKGGLDEVPIKAPAILEKNRSDTQNQAEFMRSASPAITIEEAHFKASTENRT